MKVIYSAMILVCEEVANMGKVWRWADDGLLVFSAVCIVVGSTMLDPILGLFVLGLVSFIAALIIARVRSDIEGGGRQ